MDITTFDELFIDFTELTQPESPYIIVPAQGMVLFQKNKETVYQCSYRKFFQILLFYIQCLKEFTVFAGSVPKWEKKLEELKKVRFQSKLEKITDKLRFWDHSIGNPHTSYAGAKRVDLYPKDIASFRQLNCKDTLRSLTVNGVIKAKDIEVLSEYTEVKTLYLRQMNLKDIGFLSSLVNLDELGLAGNQIMDLSPLKNMKKLTHLHIADNPVSDFSVVEELPKLRTLYADIDQLPDQLAWDTIPNRIALYVLSLTPLENYLYHAEIIYSRDVSCLIEKAGGKKKLAKSPESTQKLNIKDRWLYHGLTQSLGYQPSVQYDLTKLKTLDCSDAMGMGDDYIFLTEVGDYSCLKAATKLKTLNLSNREVNDFSWIQNCVNIQTLDLSGTEFSDLSLLSKMKQLKILRLSGCKNITKAGFAQLKNMTKLKELDVSYTAFCDLTLLEDMEKLYVLQAKGCENLIGMENMLYHLINLAKYSFSEKETYRFHMAVLDVFCKKWTAKGNHGKICAYYGHSISIKISKEEKIPPDVLYHGTANRFMQSIRDKGLLPQNRQYVHLSQDVEMAKMVGKRHDSNPKILMIDAKAAYMDGIKFYIGNENVWLADQIPYKYIHTI